MTNFRLACQIADPYKELLEGIGHMRVAARIMMEGDQALRLQAGLVQGHADELDAVWNAMEANRKAREGGAVD